jgi:opacity protein-like surface antigen
MIEMGSQRFRLAGWLSVVLLLIAAVPAVCAVSPAYAEDTMPTGNRVFFRGGYAQLSSDRSNELFTDGHSAVGSNNNIGGYYVGGGEDVMMTRDLWGMMKGTALVGEIGVEFKRWNSNVVANSDTAIPPGPGGVTGVSTGGTTQVQLTMLTVSVSPKVKFMQGTDFQPWVIPVGLDFNVISPPSNQTQYLDVGVQFGAGGEYRVWKELWLGVDSRYHVGSNQTNTVNNFWTIGPYIAIGF